VRAFPFLVGLLILIPITLSPNVYAQTDPVEVRIVIDEPTHDGLYLQNDKINFTIYFINHGEQPVNLHYGFDHKIVDAGHSLANLDSADGILQPNANFSYPISRTYSAGNYQIIAAAYANNTNFGDRKEFYFWVATPVELYTRQALNYTLYGVIISAVVAGATVFTAIWTRRSNERQRKDTKDYVDKQLKLQEDSTKALQESNRLTQESLKLKQSEYKTSLGKPELELVNDSLEYSGSSVTMRLYPNYRNDGKQDARNVRIYHHVFDKVVGLDEIVKLENEIKSSSIEVPGSVAPSRSINLHTANAQNKSIEMRRKDKPYPTSVAVWYTYDYLDNEHDEVIFNLQYTDTSPDNKPIRYNSTEIAQTREKLRGKT